MTRILRVAAALALALFAGRAWGAEEPAPERSLLVATGQPVVNIGTVAKGQDILTVPVRHGITGVLKAELRLIGWTKRPPLAAGQPLYGVPMTGQTHWSKPEEDFIVWCAPRRAPGKTGRRAIEAYCIAPQGTSFVAVEAYSPLLQPRLDMSHTLGVFPPQIEEGPAEIGFAMTAVYRIAGWRRDRATLRVYIRSELGEHPVGEFEVPRLGDGTALVGLLDGHLALTRGEKDAVEVQVLQPLTDKGDLGL